MEEKRWAIREACLVWAELRRALLPACVRLKAAGSIRRRRATVGDIEIVYIPRRERRPDPGDLFGGEGSVVDLAGEAVSRLEEEGILGRRPDRIGRTTFGPRNKLMVHLPSGMPVDLFAADPESWANVLACRTGPAALNTLVAAAARRRGLRWNPYGTGFSGEGEGVGGRQARTEREVYRIVGLPYLDPWDREIAPEIVPAGTKSQHVA